MKKNPPLHLRLETEGDSCIIIRLAFQDTEPVPSSPSEPTDEPLVARATADTQAKAGHEAAPPPRSTDPINAELNRVAIYLAQSIQKAIGQELPEALIEAIPSFDAVGVYYDLDRLPLNHNAETFTSPFAYLSDELRDFSYQQIEAYAASADTHSNTPHKIVEIPVCYDEEFGIDLAELSRTLGLSIEQIIALHTKEPMHVFMLGFSPGMPFHGLFDPALNLPRRPQPRTQLVAGSIGIANRQGVIYPFATPGGWHIVGRTPLRLFNAEQAPYTLYQAGDKVQFKAISKTEFLALQAQYGTGDL